jgi:hypothetical protein
MEKFKGLSSSSNFSIFSSNPKPLGVNTSGCTLSACFYVKKSKRDCKCLSMIFSAAAFLKAWATLGSVQSMHKRLTTV